MAKEPNKSPDDKDDAFDEGLEEIDLDDLLLDDDTPLKEEGAAPAPGKEGGEDSRPNIIDDGEMDLLADDIAEPAPVEDLLDLEEEIPADAGRQTELDAGAGSRIESPTNGNPPDLDDEMALAPEGKDEDTGFDLLAEDDVPADFLDDVPAEDATRSSPVPEMTLAEPSSAPEDETAPLAAAEDDVAPVAGSQGVTPKKKLGKLRGGKPLGPGKKGKKGKEEAPEAAVEKAKGKPAKERAPREKPAAIPAGARGSIAFVCSECYEEFLIPSSYSQEMVSCPECLHVGKRPDEEFLRTVHLHKAGEKRSFLSAVLVGALLFAVVIALMWMHTPYGAGQAGADGTLSMALLGAAGLLTVILIWLVVRFEGNRWEVYF